MHAFAKMFETLNNTTSTNDKVAALVKYFSSVPARDAVWGLYFLTGRRLKRLIPSTRLREWVCSYVKIEPWLLEESYIAVGDLGETIALLVDSLTEKTPEESLALADWVEKRILPLKNKTEVEQQKEVTSWWHSLDLIECFLINKILTGSFRVGVSEILVIRALSQIAQIPTDVIAQRIIGNWDPTEEFFKGLLTADEGDVKGSRPYPFFLASPLERDIADLGAPSEWSAEWKWDGIRCQIVKRDHEVFLWSRGEELITDSFPDLVAAAAKCPHNFVIDGELLAMENGVVRPFSDLQKRLGRKKPSAKVMAETKVGMMLYDCLEEDGKDLRTFSLHERRVLLNQLANDLGPPFYVSALIPFAAWDDLKTVREKSRSEKVEGLMLKRLNSTYQVGRRRGDWWKWKVDPFSIDAVLIYAQAGHGRRANLYTDYTFAAWDNGHLVPVAKAYSGLSDAEILELDRWIRSHTLEKFGPVRSVQIEQVFELAFEGIAASTRHKSGVALRFPRILRWRHDKKPEEADTLNSMRELLHAAH